MVREMRDDAGLQVVYDRASLEVTDQQPGHELNAMNAYVGVNPPAVRSRLTPRRWWMI